MSISECTRQVTRISRDHKTATVALQDGAGPVAASNDVSSPAAVRAFFEELRQVLADRTLGVRRVQIWSARKRRAAGPESLESRKQQPKNKDKSNRGAEKEKNGDGSREVVEEKEKDNRNRAKERRAPGALPVRIGVLYEMAAIGPRDIRDLLVVRIRISFTLFTSRVK